MTHCTIIYQIKHPRAGFGASHTCPICENAQRWTDEKLAVTLQLCFVTGWKCARCRSDTAAEKQTETKSLTKRRAAARVHKRALYAFPCNKPLFSLAGPFSNGKRKTDISFQWERRTFILFLTVLTNPSMMNYIFIVTACSTATNSCSLFPAESSNERLPQTKAREFEPWVL